MRQLQLLLVVSLAAILTGVGTAFAIPAYPHPIRVTQSDGTQLTIRIIGDEYFHYALSQEGYTLTGGADGDLYYAALSPSGTLIPTQVKARPINQLTAQERSIVSKLGKELKPTYIRPMNNFAPLKAQHSAFPAAGTLTPPDRITTTTTTGPLKSLVILIEYPDTPFRAGAAAQQNFHNLLMQDGYSVNGATGSAWNYYQDNSLRQFDPEFVVVGPYKASHKSSYYAGDGGSENVPELIVEACRLANNDIDFSQFADNGIIRDVFVFFAGHNQAETSDPQTIWPHRWDVRGDYRFQNVYLDGMQLQGYACSSELNYNYQMAGIGTFCHEFGHVLGWPDFYDTDYKGSGGESPALENFSLMCSGSYNNAGRTPPSVNILERWMAGWATPEELSQQGSYTLAPVSDNKGYLVQTPTANDYFLLENRDTRNNKWDLPLNTGNATRGLLVYHVDYTPSYASRWSANTLNNSPSHECMKLVRSVPGSNNSPARTFFPGSDNITQLTSKSNTDYASWKREAPGVSFNTISLEGSQVKLAMKSIMNLQADVLVNQNDALLTWEGDPGAEWEITWTSGSKRGQTTVTGANYFHLNGLEPATKYTIRIAQVSPTIENSKTLTVTTASLSLSKSPRIRIPDEGFVHGKPFMLSILDYPDTIEKIVWYVDNRKVTDTYLALSVGEHSLMAVITDAEDAPQQYIVKYITVK